jgi:hypothetical protein
MYLPLFATLLLPSSCVAEFAEPKHTTAPQLVLLIYFVLFFPLWLQGANQGKQPDHVDWGAKILSERTTQAVATTSFSR